MTREEAIERIKYCIEKQAWALDENDTEALYEVIPELRESEDERIRKAIMEVLKRVSGATDVLENQGTTFKKAMIWLEKKKEQTEELSIRLNGLMQEYVKSGEDEEEQEHRLKCYQLFWDALEDSEFFVQKEQKPNKQEWSKEDEEMRINILQEIANIKEVFPKINIQPEFDWLKSLPERFNLQPKQEWSEDWREEDIQTRFAFYTYKDDPSVLYLSNVFVEETSRNHGFGTRILRAAEKVAETIGATTISLKVKQDSPANAWYRKNGYGYVAFEDGYDWLEKNLEYMKPNKQEWSEEDEKMRGTCIDLLEHFPRPCGEVIGPWKDCIAWLKSLKNRGNSPKSNTNSPWKPSEEQMEALKDAVKLYKETHFENFHQRIESLYEQLKKMM